MLSKISDTSNVNVAIGISVVGVICAIAGTLYYLEGLNSPNTVSEANSSRNPNEDSQNSQKNRSRSISEGNSRQNPDSERLVKIDDVGYLRPEQIDTIIRTRGKEVRMNAPIILRQQFGQKGYAIIQNNLSQTNTKLNEFVELMRMDGLSILNGCKNPKICKCNFRHKRCRLFIARLESYQRLAQSTLNSQFESNIDARNKEENRNSNVFKFYSSNCEGIMRIKLDEEANHAFLTESVISDGPNSDVESVDSTLSDEDDETSNDSVTKAINRSLHRSLEKIDKITKVENRVSSKNLRKLVNLFEKDFTNSCVDIIEYLHYVIGHNSSNYTADIIFIADPFYEGYSHTQDNGYGRPVHSCDASCGSDCKTLETRIDTEDLSCCTDWHQDIFLDTDGDCRPYDYVALFVLDGTDITPHQLMIGQAEYEIETETGSDMVSDITDTITDAKAESLRNKIINSDRIEIIDTISEDSSESLITTNIENIPNSQNVLPRSPMSPSAPKSIRQIYTVDLDRPHMADIGYIIDQGKDLFHRHSQFTYKSTESRRNVLAIRFRYYQN